MRTFFLLSLSLAVGGCTNGKSDSEGGDTTGNSETDTDTDTDTDSDADADPATAAVTGTAVAYDGTTPAGVEVQVCDLVCYSVETDATGAFVKTGLKAGSYKVDAIGPSIDGDYGQIRAHVELEVGEEFAFPAAFFMPKVYGPEAMTGDPVTVGDVTITADADSFAVPFGYDENLYWAGVVQGPDIPPLWETPAAPAVAVSFLPLATTVSASFDILFQSDVPAGSYNVYSVDDHGVAEGPVGTATADGTVMSATGVQPAFLTWLLFVPAV